MTQDNKLPTITCSRCGAFLGFGKVLDGEVYLLCHNRRCRNSKGERRWVAVVGQKQDAMGTTAMSRHINESIEEVKRQYYGECEVYDAKNKGG